MKNLVSFLWFRILLFVVSIVLSYYSLVWYFKLPEIVDGDGERQRCALLILMSLPILFSVHTFFSLREKELLFTRPMCFFLILFFTNLQISFFVGFVECTEILVIISLLSEIFLYSISDDIKLIKEKINKERKKWEFTPIA